MTGNERQPTESGQGRRAGRVPDASSAPTSSPTPRVRSGPGAGAIAAIAAGAVVFAALTLGVALRWAPLIGADESVERSVHRVAVAHREVVLPVFGVVPDLGSPLVMNVVVLAGAVALFMAAQRRAAAYLVAARLLELGVETLLKNTVARPRPGRVDPLATATSTSFPSGHSAGTAVVYAALLVVGLGVVGWPAVGLARAGAVVGVAVGAVLLVAVPVSRVVLGVHYPSDVIGGMLLGLLCAAVLSSLARHGRGAV